MNQGPSTPQAGRRRLITCFSRLLDLLVTLLLWCYFTVGFLVLFSPLYILASILPVNRVRTFQRLNHYFYRGFFLLCRLTMPKQKWHIDPALADVRSSVVISNHISYIDPLLLISLFPRHTTIVKSRLFHIPIFGSMLKMSGYLSSDSKGPLAGHMLAQMDGMLAFMNEGGNLFIFPEGTRSRNAALGPLNPGAFKIARLCRAPLTVVHIENSDRLFTPGRFLFNTSQPNNITVRLLARLTPAYDSEHFSVKELMGQVRTLFETPCQSDAFGKCQTSGVRPAEPGVYL
ncbi:MAG: 1-acyl-sn-glycerol-3-phosphate acyltransferase [Syntrophobacteraceae bacterium]